MSRIRDLIKNDENGDDRSPHRVEPVMAGNAEGPLPWLEPAPEDFDDDNLDDQPLIPRKWLMIGGLLFLTLLAGVVYAVYQRSASKGVSGPVVMAQSPGVDDPRIPLIEAPKAPIREKPANPGGMQVADIDKKVYDVVDGQVTEEPTQLAQGAEVPVERPTPPPPGPPTNPIPDVDQVEPPATVIATPEPVKRPVVKQESVKPVIEKPVVVQKPAEKPVIKPEPPKPAVKPEPVIASGSVYVQLGAFSSRDRAESAWNGLSGKPGLSGLSSNIQAAGPAKFRLRAGPLASRGEAEAVCAKLSAAGQACLIAK